MGSGPFRIRKFAASDAQSVVEIYYRSVHEVACAKYDKAQLDAWAPCTPDPSTWLPDLLAFHTYLAVDKDETAVAWIAMRPDGYIDMLFCLPEAIGRGAAAQLYDTVERIAMDAGVSRMTAYASLFAEPFFKKRGWKVEKYEVLVRDGADIPRAEMSKDL
jgi:putative acetyltransferase